MVTALLAAGAFAFVAPAPACSPSEPSFHVGDEENCPLMRKNVLGAKVIGIASIPIGEPQDAEPQAGIGVLYERTLVAIGSAGLFFWMRERFGLLLEADYAIVREPSEWRQEIEGTTGPVWRF